LASRPPTRLSAAEGRRFAFTVGAAFVLLGGLLSWRGARVAPAISLGLGGLLIGAGLIAPAHLGWTQDRWMMLAHLISRVTTPIFMGAVFFVVMTPIGLLRRWLAPNALAHEDKDGSFWKPTRSSTGRRSSMERQF